MMSDGTIHGDNGTIWATTGTQNIKRNDRQLDGTYKDYGLTGLTRQVQKIDPQLKAKFVHSIVKIILRLCSIKHKPGGGADQRSHGNRCK